LTSGPGVCFPVGLLATSAFIGELVGANQARTAAWKSPSSGPTFGEAHMHPMLVKASPVTLSRTDVALAALARALPRLDGIERAAALAELDRLLDIRLALMRAPVEAGR
jgi:hypothetical protein